MNPVNVDHDRGARLGFPKVIYGASKPTKGLIDIVLIVVAGFEGALPTVVGGLLPQPIIGVPTSVGYGVGTNGTAALHTIY